MRRLIGGGFVLTALLSIGLGCSTTSPDDMPWMRDLIARLSSEPLGFGPAEIVEYEYQGRLVYFVPVHRCCDFMSDLYDREGVIICHPDGGIVGHGDGRCPDFFTRRSHKRLVWRDDRR
jgi:hypothetical protein